MSKRFYTNIDLRLNQLIKARLENIDSTSVTAGNPGRVFWATDLDKPCFWDGTSVLEFFYKGESLDPRTISQVGDSTESIFLSTQDEKDSWNQVAADSTAYEQTTNKNAADGYAGLDATAKLDLAVLWNGMVIPTIDGPGWDGSSYMTLGEAMGVAYGVAKLDSNAELDALVLKQAGYDSTEKALLVSQDEKDVWNAAGGGAFEEVANKNQADGYAGLDSSAYVPHEHMGDGVVVRSIKIFKAEFQNPLTVGDVLYYTWESQPTENFNADSTSPDMATTIAEMANHISTTAPQNTVVSTASDATSIELTALVVGDDFQVSFGAAGPGGIVVTQAITQPAFYDLSNIGGVANIGFAPLNALGIVDNQFLPDYKDIRIVDTYDDTGTTLLSITDQFNGLRVHVVNATDDPANTDSSGWAEYLWFEDTTSWSRTAERESNVDFQHNSAQNKQGGNEAAGQFYHLDAVQHSDATQIEHVIKIENVNPSDGTGIQLFSLDSTEWRAAKVAISVEDHGNGIYGSTFYKEFVFFYDGNYPVIMDHSEVGSPILNPFTFIPDHDINSLYLYANSDSTDSSFFIRLKKFDMFNSGITPVLTPQVDLLPADGLTPDYLAEGGQGVVPTGTQTPGSGLTPGSP